MTTSSNKWQQNIANAVQELDSKSSGKNNGSISFQMPPWTAYLACIVFGAILAKTLLGEDGTHPLNPGRDYDQGSKVAMLMTAEDIQSYWDTYGELPESSPSAIADVLNITYEKLAIDHYQLTMVSDTGTIRFDGKQDEFLMD